MPSFREFTRNNRMVTMANDFLTGIQVARTEAIKRQVVSGGAPVRLRQSGCREAGLPRQGRHQLQWLDRLRRQHSDCVRDPDAKKGEVVLRAGSRIDTTNTAASYRTSVSNGACIVFAATGFVRADSPKTNVPVRTVFCDERGNTNQSPSIPLSVARGVEVTATGRARITRDKKEIADWGDKLECK